jgi:hypothetical protein
LQVFFFLQTWPVKVIYDENREKIKKNQNRCYLFVYEPKFKIAYFRFFEKKTFEKNFFLFFFAYSNPAKKNEYLKKKVARNPFPAVCNNSTLITPENP